MCVCVQLLVAACGVVCEVVLLVAAYGVVCEVVFSY